MILDLFAGPGGWSEGLRAIGLADVGLEWDRDACLTRAAAGHKTVRADVSVYPVEPFVGKVRGLIASPPCQAFSMAGKREGMKDLGKIHAAVEAARSGWRDELRGGEWADPVKWVSDRPAPTLSLSGSTSPVGGSGSEKAWKEAWGFGRPATTICNEIVSGPGHRDMGPNGVSRQDAEGSISISEAAVLQSFPADYPFRGSKTARFRQVGDAVCPRMAAVIIGALTGALTDSPLSPREEDV